MTFDRERVVAAIRSSWPDADLDGEPVRLTGGYWADIWRLRLAGAPGGVPRDLVLRVAPEPAAGRREIAIQAAMARAGVPTPQIRLTGGPDDGIGAVWALMDLASGEPLLAGLDAGRALRRLPHLARTLPVRLASAMAAVHPVGPAPVMHDVRSAAPSAALTLDERWPHLHGAAAASGRPDLADVAARLHRHQPDHDAAVICHGDLHPLNLLAGDTGDGFATTVLDWTAAVVAPPAYDVAFTWLLLRHPPLAAPPALRAAIGPAAAALAHRFVRLYRRADSAADLRPLRWYAGLHALRVLVEDATWTRTGDPRADRHPWHLVAPGATTVLRRALRSATRSTRPAPASTPTRSPRSA